MASRMLSVPPDDTAPQISSAVPWLPSMAAVMATISDSNLLALGKRSECRGLFWDVTA